MSRSENESQLKDEGAGIYDSWYLERGEIPVFIEDTTILRHLNFETMDKSFLDAGCGTGRLTHQIACKYPNLKIVALDLSKKSLDILERKGAANITTRHFDFSKDTMHALDLKEEFDKILSMQMLQHLDRAGADHAIKELYSRLSPGGTLVVELYNYMGLNRRIERNFKDGNRPKLTLNNLFFEYRYAAMEFQKFALENAPFRSAKVFGCQNISRRWVNKFPVLSKLDLFLSRFSFSHRLGYYFVCVLKK